MVMSLMDLTDTSLVSLSKARVSVIFAFDGTTAGVDRFIKFNVIDALNTSVEFQ